MTVKLLDYARKAVEVNVGDLNDIGRMYIEVVTGDEILTVIYKDFTVEKFDSSRDRMMNYFDNLYEIYNVITGLNLLEDEQFVNRTHSYWYEDAWFDD